MRTFSFQILGTIAALSLTACEENAPVRSSIYFSEAEADQQERCLSAEKDVNFDAIAGLDNDNVLFNPAHGLVCVFNEAGELRLALIETPRKTATHALSSLRLGGITRERVTTLRRLRD